MYKALIYMNYFIIIVLALRRR